MSKLMAILNAPHCTVQSYPPGEDVQSVTPGDFLLLDAGDDLFCKLIRFGQRLRFRGADAHYARFNHAALFVTSNGGIIEALSEGIKRRNVSCYHDAFYLVVHIDADTYDRQEVVTFAASCLNEGYGWWQIASIALSLLTGSKFSFGYDGQEICSGLVARALERTSAIFPRDASHMMPADLAKYYGVE